MNLRVKHIIPFAVLAAAIALVYITNLHEYFTIDMLQKEQKNLLDYLHEYPFLFRIIFILIYVVSVILVIPDSTILTLLGALTFPFWEALLLALSCETLGALAFFAIFHTTFKTPVMRREDKILRKIRKGFSNNTASYLLCLRVSHLIPFWLTNVAAAYFKVRYKTFIWTTFVGVIPYTYIVANAGRSLAKVFAKDQMIEFSDMFTTQVKVALIFLGIVALIPILFKKYLHRKRWK